jgi:hypothetical protein
VSAVCRGSATRSRSRTTGQEGAYRLHREALLGDQAEARRLLGYDCAIVRLELRGRDLGCYCAPACRVYADTLLAVANAET